MFSGIKSSHELAKEDIELLLKDNGLDEILIKEKQLKIELKELSEKKKILIDELLDMMNEKGIYEIKLDEMLNVQYIPERHSRRLLPKNKLYNILYNELNKNEEELDELLTKESVTKAHVKVVFGDQ